MWAWKTRQSGKWLFARRQEGGQGSRFQGSSGRTRRPQSGRPDGLARGVHVNCVQESRAQVQGRNGRNDGGAFVLRKGVPGLLGDLGA
jgi:hypothetical protein